MGSAGAGGVQSRYVQRAHRRLRRDEHEHLYLLQSDAEPAGAGDGAALPASPEQRQGFPHHPGVLQAQPARAQRGRADRVFHLPGGRASGLPVPHQLRMRHGPGRGRLRAYPSEIGLSLPGRGHPLARRPLPPLFRRRQGHGRGRGRGPRRAQASGGRIAGWGHDLRSHSGHGHQQRRRRQGGLHRAQRGRPGQGHRHGPGAGRGGPIHHLLHRGPRHGHHAGRSHRDRGPDPGLSGAHR